MSVKFNVLTGPIRSGKTAFRAVINQHPDVWCSAKSGAIDFACASASIFHNNPDEVQKGRVIGEDILSHRSDIIKSGLDIWHNIGNGYNKPVILDNSRAWVRHRQLLREVYPNSVIICMIRDPREVVASNERSFQKRGLLNTGTTQAERIQKWLNTDDGEIGVYYKHMTDMVGFSDVLWIDYNEFVTVPDKVMIKVTNALGLEDFEFDFDNLQSAFDEDESINNFVYSHDVSGKLEKRHTGWDDVLEPEVANFIVSQYPKLDKIWGWS